MPAAARAAEAKVRGLQHLALALVDELLQPLAIGGTHHAACAFSYSAFNEAASARAYASLRLLWRICRQTMW